MYRSCKSLIDMYSKPRDLADVTSGKLAPTRLGYFWYDMVLPMVMALSLVLLSL